MRMDKCYTTQWANTAGRTTFTEQDSQGTHSRTLYTKVTCSQIQWPLIPFHIELCLLPAKGEKCVDSRWTVYASFNRYCSLEKGHCLFFLGLTQAVENRNTLISFPALFIKAHTGWGESTQAEPSWAPGSSTPQVWHGFHLPRFSILITSLVRAMRCPPYKLSSSSQVQQNTQCISFNVYGKYLYTQALHKALFIAVKIKQYQDPRRAMNFLSYC